MCLCLCAVQIFAIHYAHITLLLCLLCVFSFGLLAGVFFAVLNPFQAEMLRSGFILFEGELKKILLHTLLRTLRPTAVFFGRVGLVLVLVVFLFLVFIYF